VGITRFHQRWARARRAVLAGAVVAAFAVVFVAASGALNGSTFESADGNLAITTAGNEDWANAPSRTRQDDPTGSSQDNALGQGTKEDDPNVSVVQGSIPPNKSDLTRFYTSTEKVGGNTFLYLAWERTNVLGSANMDFELNQSSTAFPASGAVKIVRTAGDLLFTYDFTNGGTKPTLGLLTWLTSASAPSVNGFATNACFSANSFPCWGDRIDLGAGGFADGQINSTTVSDPIANTSLVGNTFGEMGVNLTQALPNIFGPNPSACESFGSAYLKSRSSASFTAEIKDFVAPQKISVSNCGYVLVHKTAADTGNDQGGATFTVTPGKTTISGMDASDPIPAIDGHNGWYCVDNLLTNGSYTVKETVAPDGYDTPNPDSTGNLSATAGSCADVTFPNPTATVSFSDPVKLGHVLVYKTAADTGLAQTGATFSVSPGKVNGTSTDASASLVAVTGHPGYYCVDGLRLGGSFTVTELTAPSGYTLPNPAAHTSVSAAAGSCDGITWPATASTSFSDPVQLGYVLIHKTAGDTGTDQPGATFVITPGKVTQSGTDAHDTVPGVSGHEGYYCIDNLRASSTFSVEETVAPAGYDLASSPTHGNLSATAGSCPDVYAPPPTATTSYVDPLALGAIVVTKTGKDKSCIAAGNPAGCSATSTRLLSGAGFQLLSGGSVKYTSDPTGSGGTVCISGVKPGSYTLHESTIPGGYAAASDQPVTITADTTCNGTGSAAAATASVVDQPLTKITVSTASVSAGTTQSTVQCASESAPSSADGSGHTTGTLVPGTYTCTVVIDP
jgi:Prealbumin-like fold domain